MVLRFGLVVSGLHPALLHLYSRLHVFVDSDDAVMDMTDFSQSLNAIFAHVIDPSYGYDHEQAHAFHAGVGATDNL